MGKITTVFFLLFGFLFITLNSNVASAQSGGCFKTIKGKKVWGDVSYCEPQNCTAAKGRYWDATRNVCTNTPPKKEEVQSVNVVGNRRKLKAQCETIPNAHYGPQKADIGKTEPRDENGDLILDEAGHVLGEIHEFCLCNETDSIIDPAGDKNQCSQAASTAYSKDCEKRGGRIEQQGCFCDLTGFLLAQDEICEDNSAAPSMAMCEELNKLEEAAAKCVDDSKKAKEQCNQDKSGNSSLQESKAILATVGDAFLRSKAGSGKSSACAQGSLALSTSLGAFDMFKTTCDSQFNDCKESCGAVKKALESGEAQKACVAKFTAIQLPNFQPQIQAKVDKIKELSAQGDKICLVDVAQENNAANTILKDLARSTQAAKICECKQATGGSSTCDNIVSPTSCLPGGNLYGSTQCAMYGSCQLGSADYATVKCQCALGKTTVGCNTPAAAVTSNFAGIDTKPASSNSGGIDVGAGAGSGGSGSDNFDLSGVSGPKSGGDDKDVAKATNAGLTAGSGGGGGGGGSPAASPDGAAAAGAAEGEAGSGSSNGLFGMVKSMFGSGSGGSGSGSSNKTGAAKDAKYKLDYKKWAEGQKRCFASVSSTEHCQQRAGKNQDIFEVVKGRYLADPAVNPYLVPGK